MPYTTDRATEQAEQAEQAAQAAAANGEVAAAPVAAGVPDVPAEAQGAPVEAQGVPVEAQGAPARVRRRGPRPSTIVAAVVLVAGLGIIAYPSASDWWNSYHQSRAIADYVNAVQDTDAEQIDQMFAQAEAYNQRLLSKGNRYAMTDEELAEYRSLLDLTGNGVMGYVQINAINVDYPIYHGMDESVLQIAIGHLEGTSLPVGGESTHAVISGHRGLPRARLFTDLDKLVEGDTFTVTILDRTLTYEIDQVRIVLPTDLSELDIQRGADYCTLITCTPYGVNTHRMLVRGHRIDNIVDEVVVTAEAVQIPRYIAIPAVGVPILFVFLLVTLIYYRARRPEMNRSKVEDALKQASQRSAAQSGRE